MLHADTTLGAYRLISQIGAGGMGEVWKAEDTRLGRVVAIKILPPSVAADAEAIARLRREARTSAQLNHPNIATVHSFEEAGGRLFIVMEFVDGHPLSKIFKRRISEAELCRIGRSVAEALAEAHAKGVIHRDVKPENIIVGAGNRVKVLDFGIAKQLTTSTADAPTAPLLTQQGMIVGTIHYMSPEQALGKPLDPRTDIFSLGIVLYEGATGNLPFRGETITDTMTQIIRDEPRDAAVANPKISPGLASIIQRCLRKNREERFATATDLAQALERQLGRASTTPYAAEPTVLTGSKLKTVNEPRRSQAAWVWAMVSFVVVVGLVGWYAKGHRGAPAPVPPPPPAQTTVSVAAGASPAVEPARAPAPTPTAREHFQTGETALLNRNFPKAIEQYQLALDQKEQLEQRERELAHLGIAIAMHQRVRAEEIARRISRQWPDDPDLQRIRSEFGERRRPRQ